MKKLLSMLLAVVMVLAMAAPSFADTQTGTNQNSKGTITINNAIKGKKYSLYKIFDLESFSKNEQSGQYSYKVVPEWKEFIKRYSQFTLDDDGYLTKNDSMSEAESRAFAQAALEWAKGDTTVEPNRAPISSVTVRSTSEKIYITNEKGESIEDPEHEKLTFSNLDLGYYLVDSSVGALCSLGTTDTIATIIEKNDVPTVDKKIVETENNQEVKVEENSVSVGDVITYESVIVAKPGAQTYVFHDDMTDGLTFIDNETINNTLYKHSITWNNGTTDVILIENTDYTLTKKQRTNKEYNGFNITFTSTFMEELNNRLNSMSEPKEVNIVIRYYAQLNEDAVIYGTGSNNNTAYLTYGNTTNDNRTPDSTTKTYTFKTSVYKYTNGENGTKAPLAGAEFSLSLSGDVTNHAKIYVVKLLTANGTTSVYRVATPEEIEAKGESLSDTITTDATGVFEIQGLEGQVYYLHEEKAPAGYNKLTDPIKIEIYAKEGVIPDSDPEIKVERGQTVTDKETINGNDTVVAPGVVDRVEVYNNSGALLPSTGGIGTTIFYAAGIILMAGAVFFVVRRKKA